MALIEIDGLPGFTVLNSMVDLSMAMLNNHLRLTIPGQLCWSLVSTL